MLPTGGETSRFLIEPILSSSGDADGGFAPAETTEDAANHREQRREQVRQNMNNTPDVEVVTPRRHNEDISEDSDSQKEERE